MKMRELYHETKYLKVAPTKQILLSLSIKMFLYLKNITSEDKTSFGKFSGVHGKGAYLIIEHTEALHVIDVNKSGNRSNKASNQRYCIRGKHDRCR
jgi:ribonuclease G